MGLPEILGITVALVALEAALLADFEVLAEVAAQLELGVAEDVGIVEVLLVAVAAALVQVAGFELAVPAGLERQPAASRPATVEVEHLEKVHCCVQRLMVGSGSWFVVNAACAAFAAYRRRCQVALAATALDEESPGALELVAVLLLVAAVTLAAVTLKHKWVMPVGWGWLGVVAIVDEKELADARARAGTAVDFGSGAA